MTEIKPKSNSGPRGGRREGAGRPAGSLNRAITEQKVRLSDLAKTHAEEAISALVAVAKRGKSETARVAAACAILDRAYGRPGIVIETQTSISEWFSNALAELHTRATRMPINSEAPSDD